MPGNVGANCVRPRFRNDGVWIPACAGMTQRGAGIEQGGACGMPVEARATLQKAAAFWSGRAQRRANPNRNAASLVLSGEEIPKGHVQRHDGRSGGRLASSGIHGRRGRFVSLNPAGPGMSGRPGQDLCQVKFCVILPLAGIKCCLLHTPCNRRAYMRQESGFWHSCFMSCPPLLARHAKLRARADRQP